MDFKTDVFVFPFSFKLHFSISFSPLPFSKYPNIATSIIFAPALRIKANEDSQQCQYEVGLSLTNLSLLWRVSTGDLYSFFHQFPFSGRRRRSNLGDKMGLKGNPCLMGAVCPNVRLTSSHYWQGRFAIQFFFGAKTIKSISSLIPS